jgi:DNA-nicking Smr family endonuclease
MRGRGRDASRGRRRPRAVADHPAGARAPALNAPFADLGKKVRALPPPAPARPVPVAPPPAARREAPEDLFAHAMTGVVPLTRGSDRVGRMPPAPAGRRPVSEEAEALAVLSDLVGGNARFDISDTREYIEGAIGGLDPRVLRKLRHGDYSWQAYLDLHGMTADEARAAVARFLIDSVRAGHRCVLIVHGRGLNSKDQIPVLKEHLKQWLARGQAARIVLAFTSARPCDGGAGASYVLLRRDRRRRAIDVIEGAKR